MSDRRWRSLVLGGLLALAGLQVKVWGGDGNGFDLTGHHLLVCLDGLSSGLGGFYRTPIIQFTA